MGGQLAWIGPGGMEYISSAEKRGLGTANFASLAPVEVRG